MLLTGVAVHALYTGDEKRKSMRVLMLSPFLLSALEELTQGLGRGKPFSKYAMQDLENCCSVGFLLSGAQTELLPGSTFQMIQQEVHYVLLSIPSGCVLYINSMVKPRPPANFFSFPSRVTFHSDLVGVCT